MSYSNPENARWNQIAYQQITSVHFGHDLEVTFADGDKVQVDSAQVLPRGTNLEDVDWWRVAHNEMEIIIPIGPNWFEVPWDVIRRQTDPDFRTHWIRMTIDIAETTGDQLRVLRQQQQMSLEELAERTHIAKSVLLDLEQGRYESDVDITPILLALGASEEEFSKVRIG